MNLKELSQLTPEDLKNINFSNLKEDLSHRLDIVINIILIIVTLFFSFKFIVKNKNTAKQLKLKMTELSEKIKAVEDLKNTQQSYQKFLNEFPEALETDKLINLISNFAVNHHVQILSFSPAEQWKNDYYELTNIKLKILSEDYDDIINFLKEIESTSYAIRLSDWTGRLNDQSVRNLDNIERIDYSITADLEIDTMKVLQ
ncbi:MAG: type 4a pilus biogenesis protein PilO [Candidatus Omnitrophica bacterium]|nr:type 4a pilus biogenesis protein PilO [Candidatus Omnitrophota bacterium]MCB9748252.1 type 4a pilus biogenesis protein PilO [Candidatus Omnitrophota bacterium]